MARVKLEIDFPGLSIQDLIDLVRAHDDEPPIDADKVRASDVLHLWLEGEFPQRWVDGEEVVRIDKMEE